MRPRGHGGIDPCGLVACPIQIAHDHRIDEPVARIEARDGGLGVSTALTVPVRTAAAVSSVLAVASTPWACCICFSLSGA
jgi:hypothetical protein